MRTYILLLAVVFSGCAFTPPGALKTSDLITEHKVVKAGYQTVYKRVRDGFRTCGERYVESELYTDLKEGQIDVFSHNAPIAITLGLITIKQITKDSTRVTVSANKAFDSPFFHEEGFQRKQWLRWATGDRSC